MKRLFIFLGMVLIAFLLYKYAFKKDKPHKQKPQPVTVSKYGKSFNESMDTLLSRYYRLTDGFVNWDSVAVSKDAVQLQQAFHNLKIDDLKKDTTIYQTALFPVDNAKAAVGTILQSTGWAEKRRALNDLSDNIRMLLLTVKYDQAQAYWQECPMAFGEGEAGNWLSNKPDIVNPYLGNKDPKYGNTMLHCGETKTTINFTGTDSTKQQ